MSKHNYKRSFFVAIVLGVLGIVSACDRASELVQDSDRDKPARMAATTEAHEKSGEAAYSSVAEARHFDVYNHARTLFDDAADYIPSHLHESRNGIMPAIGTYSAIRPGASMARCFTESGNGGD